MLRRYVAAFIAHVTSREAHPGNNVVAAQDEIAGSSLVVGTSARQVTVTGSEPFGTVVGSVTFTVTVADVGADEVGSLVIRGALSSSPPKQEARRRTAADTAASGTTILTNMSDSAQS
jgi:hypothetical protein